MNGIYLNVINNDDIYELKEEWKSYKCSKKRKKKSIQIFLNLNINFYYLMIISHFEFIIQKYFKSLKKNFFLCLAIINK